MGVLSPAGPEHSGWVLAVIAALSGPLRNEFRCGRAGAHAALKVTRQLRTIF